MSVAESGPGVEAEPGENNPCCLHVVVAGPQDSPLEGGTFKLELFLPEEYPTAAPKVCLMMQFSHSIIDKSERICSDILKGKCCHPVLYEHVLSALSCPCSECTHCILPFR